MTIRVLIVDGSGYFRRRLTEILNANPVIEVVDYAVNGHEAVEKVKNCRPDVVAMDVDVPVMNGVEATRKIMQQCPTPIIIFTSFTIEGGQSALDALEAGAVDFLPKRFDEVSRDITKAREIICTRIKKISESASKRKYASSSSNKPETTGSESVSLTPVPVEGITQDSGKTDIFIPGKYDLIVIGASVGGPETLNKLLPRLPADFPIPVLLIQHMPQIFTEVFADRLNMKCEVKVREARSGDELEPGMVFVAPGGLQTKLEKRAGRLFIRVEEENKQEHNSGSCIDVTLGSINEVVGKRALVIVLSGIGDDGKISCNKLRKSGAVIWAQDEESSTIYDMPSSIVDIADKILPVKEMASKLTTSDVSFDFDVTD